MKFAIVLFAIFIFGCSASPQLGVHKLDLFKFHDRVNPRSNYFKWDKTPFPKTSYSKWDETRDQQAVSKNFNTRTWYNLFNWLNSLGWFSSGNFNKNTGATSAFEEIELIFEIIYKLQNAIDNGQTIQIIEFIKLLKPEFIKLRSFIPSKYHRYILNIFVNLYELQQLTVAGNLAAVKSVFGKLKNSLNLIAKTAYNGESFSARMQIIFNMVLKLRNYLSSGQTRDAGQIIIQIIVRLRTYLAIVPASIRSFFRTMITLFVQLRQQVSMGHTQSINDIFFKIIFLFKQMGKKVSGGGNIGARWGDHSGLVKGLSKCILFQ